jgi:SAM-dependent methyltransferase
MNRQREDLFEHLDEVEKSINEVKKGIYSAKNIRTILEEIFNYDAYGREEKSEEEQGSFKYIPESRAKFIYYIKEIQKREKKKKFIDIGCGIGDKVALAYLFGEFDEVFGIELNETTYHVAKYFLGNGVFRFENFDDYEDNNYSSRRQEEQLIETPVKRKILWGNAFDHDFSNYDFIYMYKPIAEWSGIKKLYEKVLSEMPIGGVSIEIIFGSSFASVVKEVYDIEFPSPSPFKYYIKKTGKRDFERISLSERFIKGK